MSPAEKLSVYSQKIFKLRSSKLRKKPMENKKLSLSDYHIFFLKSIFFLGIVWVSFILALLGFFYASFIWIAAVICGIFFFWNAASRGMRLTPSAEMMIASAVIALIALSFSIFSTPTVFSGRDQGSISEAAIRLAQNHTIEFSTPASSEFFKIYGPGRALNFPGFYYTENGQLTSQFPLVYIVWLALFFALFGTTGFAVANAILGFMFLMALYLLLRFFLKIPSSSLGIAFIATSFIFMWFSKFTLSENMALPILWISILSLILFLRRPRKLSYAVLLASSALICFTRIEGFAFFVVSIAIIFLSRDAREFIKAKILKRILLPLGFFVAILLLNAVQDISFYIELAKTLIPKVTPPQAQQFGEMKNTVLPPFYTGKIFHLYGLLGFFILGMLGAVVQALKKDVSKLIPLFVVAPTFIYFLNSHITPDHPWMLRRFAFSIFPAAVFYTAILVGEQIEKNQASSREKKLKFISIFISLALIAGNLVAFVRYFPFSEHKNLLAQTEMISEQFSSNDLVLLDREVTGDGWSMISGPMSSLFGKNAVYFFNNQDFNKLDLDKFEKVYLMAPASKANYYLNSTIGNRLSPVNNYSFTFPKLNMGQKDPLKKVIFPEKKEFLVTGKIFQVSK